MPNRPELPASESGEHPGTKLVGALIANLRASEARTVMRDDDRHPGRTNYEIVGPNRDAVQAAIDKAVRQVDTAWGGQPGMADFAGPFRMGIMWAAIGFVQIDGEAA